MSDHDKFKKKVDKAVKWAEKQGKPSPLGRPTDYKPEYVESVKKLCKLGAIDLDIADFYGVSEVTINAWKKKHPDFLKALNESKGELDKRVVRSLFQRATGYSHPEDKIFNDNGDALIVPTVKHYPPDATSCIFWLKNRQGKDWRDKQEVDMNANFKVNIDGKDADML